jgi:hypothetical protein
VIGVGEGANGGEDISVVLANSFPPFRIWRLGVNIEDVDVEKPRGPCHLAFGAGARERAGFQRWKVRVSRQLRR